jgi:hypothetical protein
MLPARELESSHDLPPGVVDSLEEAWFSQSRPVPRAMSSRPPRAPSVPPPAIESLDDDTADGWFASPDSEL